MRNFTATNDMNFITHTSDGVFVNDEEVYLTHVVDKLAVMFETPRDRVRSAMHEAIDGKEYSDYIAPSEYAAVVELVGFQRYALSCKRESASKVYSYHNLNTGKSIIWVHVVV